MICSIGRRKTRDALSHESAWDITAGSSPFQPGATTGLGRQEQARAAQPSHAPTIEQGAQRAASDRTMRSRTAQRASADDPHHRGGAEPPRRPGQPLTRSARPSVGGRQLGSQSIHRRNEQPPRDHGEEEDRHVLRYSMGRARVTARRAANACAGDASPRRHQRALRTSIRSPDRSTETPARCTADRPDWRHGGSKRRGDGARSKPWRCRTLRMRIAREHGPMCPFTAVNRRSMMRQRAPICRIQRHLRALFHRYRQYKIRNHRRQADAAKRRICGVNV